MAHVQGHTCQVHGTTVANDRPRDHAIVGDVLMGERERFGRFYATSYMYVLSQMVDPVNAVDIVREPRVLRAAMRSRR